MEQLLGNVNTLNRKLEESIVVGQEFEPISNLWAPFVDMLTDHGIKPTKTTGTNEGGLQTSQTDSANEQQQQRLTGSLSSKELAESTAALSASLDGPNGNRLPPGVAPGGGTVYGMSSSSSTSAN